MPGCLWKTLTSGRSSFSLVVRLEADSGPCVCVCVGGGGGGGERERERRGGGRERGVGEEERGLCGRECDKTESMNSYTPAFMPLPVEVPQNSSDLYTVTMIKEF